MIRPLDQHFLGTGNVTVNVVYHEYLGGDISIADNEECWDANLGQALPGSWLGRNLELPWILDMDMEVVHCDLRNAFSVCWCLGGRPCVYVHFYRICCPTLSVRVFLRFHLFVKLLPHLLLFQTGSLVAAHSWRNQYQMVYH